MRRLKTSGNRSLGDTEHQIIAYPDVPGKRARLRSSEILTFPSKSIVGHVEPHWSYPFRYPIRNLVSAAFWFIFLPGFSRPPFMI